MGLWRLHRGISMALAILVLPLIAIPRIYVGGRYIQSTSLLRWGL